MKLADALSELSDNCDHITDPDCWYCEISQLLQEQASKLASTEKQNAELFKALSALSLHMNNPAVHWDGDGSLPEALVQFAIDRLKGCENRLDRAGRDLERLQKGFNEEHDRAQSLSSRLDKSERMYEAAEQHVKILQGLNDQCGSKLDAVRAQAQKWENGKGAGANDWVSVAGTAILSILDGAVERHEPK